MVYVDAHIGHSISRGLSASPRSSSFSIAGHHTGMSLTTLEACKKVLQDIIHERMSLNE